MHSISPLFSATITLHFHFPHALSPSFSLQYPLCLSLSLSTTVTLYPSLSIPSLLFPPPFISLCPYILSISLCPSIFLCRSVSVSLPLALYQRSQSLSFHAIYHSLIFQCFVCLSYFTLAIYYYLLNYFSLSTPLIPIAFSACLSSSLSIPLS